MTIIAGATETPAEKWETLLGDVVMLPIVFNVQSNWSISSDASTGDRRIIDKAVELVRAEHPYVVDRPR